MENVPLVKPTIRRGLVQLLLATMQPTSGTSSQIALKRLLSCLDRRLNCSPMLSPILFMYLLLFHLCFYLDFLNIPFIYIPSFAVNITLCFDKLCTRLLLPQFAVKHIELVFWNEMRYRNKTALP